MRSDELARLLDCPPATVPRQARRAGIDASIGSAGTWSPGDALALMVLRTLDGRQTFAEGARKCGEALDAGYPPAFLVTRGGPENVVVIESESPAQTDEMVAALLLQASDAGQAIRVVKLRPMVRQLAAWICELVNA